MSARTLAVLLLVVTLTSSCWSGTLVYQGPKPTSVTSAIDTRTDVEKLQDQVDDLSDSLKAAHYLITVQQNQLNACMDALVAYELDDRPVLAELADIVQRNNDGRVTISGNRIDLDASTIKLKAATTEAWGEITCETLTAEFVDAEAYDPGAGNVW